MEDTRLVSRETRRKPVKGGTRVCSRCSEPRIASSAYCKEHHNEYTRVWKRNRTKEFRELKSRLTFSEKIV